MRGLTGFLTPTRPFLGALTALSACWLWTACPARGQSAGPGSSPGRAAYRPPAQWNNGPYYTASHWNPYAPHGAGTTNLYESEPIAPPYSTAPHGLYSTFFPGVAPLYPYADGFSPYSGFADWYVDTYKIVPTRELVQQARAQFFRSAPRPPEGVLPPLPPATPVVINPAPPRPSRPEAASVKVITPRPAGAAPRPGIRVYRSSVTGSR